MLRDKILSTRFFYNNILALPDTPSLSFLTGYNLCMAFSITDTQTKCRLAQCHVNCDRKPITSYLYTCEWLVNESSLWDLLLLPMPLTMYICYGKICGVLKSACFFFLSLSFYIQIQRCSDIPLCLICVNKRSAVNCREKIQINPFIPAGPCWS